MSESHHADRPDALAAEAPRLPSRLTVNIAYLTTAQVFANLCILLANWAVIRSYDKGVHDAVVLVVSTVGMFMIISDLGLASKAGVRTIARLRATDPGALGETVSGLVVVQLGFAAVLAVGVILLAGPINALQPRLDVPSLRLAGTWIFTFAIARASLMLFWGFERMRGALLVNPVREFARLVWVPACWAMGLEPYWIFVGWTGAHLLTCLTAALGVGGLVRQVGLRIRPRATTVAETLRIAAGGMPYYIPFLGLFGLPLVMPLVVGMLDATEGNVSMVQVCLSLALLPRLLATQIGNAVFPRMAAIHAGPEPDKARIAALLVRSGRLVCLISAGVFIAYALAGRPVLGLYEPEYRAAAGALLGMTFAVGLDSFALQLDQALMAMGYARLVAWLEVGRYVVFLAALCLLVPRYAVNGAGAALCIAAVAAAVAKIGITRRLLPRVAIWAFLAFLAVCAAVGGAWLAVHGGPAA